MSAEHKVSSTAFHQDAHIAVGPIFFVIAVLGILVASMAIGSGALLQGAM